MNLENLDEVRTLMDRLEEIEDRSFDLGRNVYSIILTDGTQTSKNEELLKGHDCRILEVHPDNDPEGNVLNRLGALFVEKIKEQLALEIESIKAKLAVL